MITTLTDQLADFEVKRRAKDFSGMAKAYNAVWKPDGIANRSKEARAWFLLGEALANEKRKDDAHDCFLRALVLDPANVWTHAEMADLICDLDPDFAELLYRRALLIETSPRLVSRALNVTRWGRLGAFYKALSTQFSIEDVKYLGSWAQAASSFGDVATLEKIAHRLGVEPKQLSPMNCLLLAGRCETRSDFWDELHTFIDRAERSGKTTGDPSTFMSDVAVANQIAEIVRSSPAGGGARVLDVGCGSGLVAASSKKYAGEVIALDASAIALNVARERMSNKDERLKLVHGEAGSWLAQAGMIELNVVVDAFTHHGMAGQDVFELYRQAHQSLKPGGRMVVAVSKQNPAGYLHDRFLTARKSGELVAMMTDAGFAPRVDAGPNCEFVIGDLPA